MGWTAGATGMISKPQIEALLDLLYGSDEDWVMEHATLKWEGGGNFKLDLIGLDEDQV
jgi:hypothetical protein